MPFQSTLMEPPQSKFIINLVELQASLLVTTVLMMTDLGIATKLVEETNSRHNNCNPHNLLPLLINPTSSEVLKRRQNSQSQHHNKFNNSKSKEVCQVPVQDLS